jgi:tripartite-type tricarboxylate transporter receptor subunit TctC
MCPPASLSIAMGTQTGHLFCIALILLAFLRYTGALQGRGPSVAATVAGETQFSFENPASSLPLVEAGRVRALASTSDRRSSQMPDVPTMIEAGIADFTSVSFTGVVAPAGTPGAIVDRLNAAINAGLQSPEIAGTLVKLGVDAKISSPQEFAAFLGAERDKWAAVIKAAGVRAE